MSVKLLFCQRGMSLLEVLISVIVLSIGVLGLAPLMMMSVETNNHSRDVIRAAELGKQRLEYIESLESLPPLPYQEADSILIEGAYHVSTLIKDKVSDSLIPAGMACATVSVAWVDNLQIRHSTSFTSMVAKP